MPIPLFTSIPPTLKRPIRGWQFGGIWQNLCIQSWMRAGYQPISVNPRAEIAILKNLHPRIEFRTVPDGFDRPHIVHLLDEAKKSSAHVVGLINADCLMAPHRLGTIKGIAIAERVGIDSRLRPSKDTCWGFDAFFFSPDSLNKITFDPHYRIGGAWWDYWFPLAFQAANLPLTVLPPIIYHINHQQAWDTGKWKQDFPKIMDIIQHADDMGDLRERLLNAPHDSLEEMRQVAHRIFKWLRQDTEQHPVSYKSSLAACAVPALYGLLPSLVTHRPRSS